jgi:hypothetical protein
MHRLENDPRFEMTIVPDLEHSLLERYSRETATRLLTDHVRSHYGHAMPGAQGQAEYEGLGKQPIDM